MKIKLLKDFRGKETKEVFYLTGSVIDLRDDYAKRLIDLGFAEKITGGETEVIQPPPPVDPTLTIKSMMTPKVAAIVEKDNEAVLRDLREQLLRDEEAQARAEEEVKPAYVYKRKKAKK